MINKITLEAKVMGGDIPAETWGYIRKALAHHEDKYVSVTVERKKRIRSTPQLRYYYGVVVPIVTLFMRETGLDVSKDDVDVWLRVSVMKLYKEIDGIKVPGHTASLSASEMEEKLEAVRRWGAYAGCNIPEPNENMGLGYGY